MPREDQRFPVAVQTQLSFTQEKDDVGVDFLDEYTDAISSALSQKPSASVDELLVQAATRTQEYERELEESEKLGYLGGLEGGMKKQYRMNDSFASEAEKLLIPQFCFATEPDLFCPNPFAKLNKERLSEDFSLKNADSNVNFSLASGEMYAVDASDSGTMYRKMAVWESEYFRSKMERQPDESRRNFCVNRLTEYLEQKPVGDVLVRSDIKAYVERVVANFSDDDFSAIQTSCSLYVSRLHQKIDELLADYRERRFFELLEARDILCRPLFELSKTITPADTLNGLEKSLYESEAAVNSVERKVIEEIAALLNVKWWHRNSESRHYSFDLNGFITHYPDFLVMTGKGTLVVVEVKGDDRDNSDSERKLRLGRKWADRAGDNYRYYMVFDKLNWSKEGAYDLPDFIELMKRL
jgi:type III restriction enzyme